MPSDCDLHQVIQSLLGFQIYEVDFISSIWQHMSFSWLALNRLCKPCLALKCIRVVVCSTHLFIKLRLFSITVN